MNESTTDFARSGYAIVRPLINERTTSFLYEYAVRAAREGKLERGDPTIATALVGRQDHFMEALLLALLPTIERETALGLYPTYSYFRIYGPGDVLVRHTDRPSCEVSISLALGGIPEQPWPLWMELEGVPKRVELAPGDGVLYRGIDIPHWRDRFDGEQVVQVFLHYVDRQGPHRDWFFDRRKSLHASPEARRILKELLSE